MHGKATEMAPFAVPADETVRYVVASCETATYSLLTVPVAEPDFRPSRPLSPLPGVLTTVPKPLLARIAREYNASEFAAGKRRWMIVQEQGGVVELANLSEEERPADANGLPFLSKSGLTLGEARDEASRLNRYLLDLCRVPRQWQVIALELPSVDAPATAPESEPTEAAATTKGGAA